MVFYGVSVGESLSLLYQWSRRFLAWRKTIMKEGNMRKRIENGIN